MRTSETYFDQIPVEIVRRIAQHDAPEKNRKQRATKKTQTRKSKRRGVSLRWKGNRESSHGTSSEQRSGRTDSVS